MNALIVYDSIFGNTEKIAQAVRKTLGASMEAGLVRAGEAKRELPAGLTLLIVGSPTRGFRPTPAVKNFLRRIPRNGLRGVRIAAFDTGIHLDDVHSAIGRFFMGRFGYAAKPILDGLRKKGGEPAAPPEGFFVLKSEGPLKDGELERATEWAKKLGEAG
jgi:flavodoxin